MNESVISNINITYSNHFSSEEEVISSLDNIKEGEFISITNRNNLAESFIYKRNKTNRREKSIKWDGSLDTTWYSDDAIEYHLTTPSQVAGIHQLLSRGIDFLDKCIYLENDIDISDFPWLPIGSPKLQISNDKYTSNGKFRGTFDGLNHIIYGLNNEQKIPFYSFAFFMETEFAQIKNIIFMDVEIRSNNVDMTASVVSLKSKRTLFSNISIYGEITGSNISSISYFSTNSSFYLCKNRANLISTSIYSENVIVGGITGILEITSELINEIPSAKIFSKCENYGRIEISGNDIYTLYAGHLFGNFLCESKNFLTVIEKCRIHSGIEFKGTTKNIDTVYFGKSSINSEPCNHFNSFSKKDLLFGLLGRIKRDCDITVINITDSIINKNMVIPGTCNTMRSESDELSFRTIMANHITDSDGLYDLEPYFRFIKSVRC